MSFYILNERVSRDVTLFRHSSAGWNPEDSNWWQVFDKRGNTDYRELSGSRIKYGMTRRNIKVRKITKRMAVYRFLEIAIRLRWTCGGLTVKLAMT